MRRLLYIVIAFLILAACSETTPEQRAAEAAKFYYDRLLEGYPEGFLEGKADIDSLPSDYCEQMVGVFRKYISDLQQQHGGISEVRISPQVARRDSTLNLTYAFLLLCYQDSVLEEITVPMVEVNGEWRMR